MTAKKKRVADEFSKDGVASKRSTSQKSCFAQEYAKSGNAILSAINVGIPGAMAPEQASAWLRDPAVLLEIKELRHEQAAKADPNAAWITDQLKKIIVQSMEVRPLLTVSGQQSIFSTMDNPQSALKALEMLGKHVGMFTDNTKIELKTLPTIRVVEEDDE